MQLTKISRRCLRFPHIYTNKISNLGSKIPLSAVSETFFFPFLAMLPWNISPESKAGCLKMSVGFNTDVAQCVPDVHP